MMSDLIERQAAIDALNGITTYKNSIPIDSAVFNIKKLPSAEPHSINLNQAQSSDLISRQAAIDAFAKEYEDFTKEVGHDARIEKTHKAIITLIKQLPSAEPQIKDIIQKFHDYQIEWLKSHHDVTFDHDTEELIIHFLHDTANCYMMEVDNE